MSDYATSTVKKTIGSVVKCSKIRDSIEKYVTWQSKAAHRGSHLLNFYVTRAYHDGVDVPQLVQGKFATTCLRHFFNPCLSRNNDGTWGTGRTPSQVPSHILDYMQRDPQHGGLGWPSLDGIPGYGRMVAFAANNYSTALKNHVSGNTWAFIKKTIYAFYMSHGIWADNPKDPNVVGLLEKIKDPSRVFSHTGVGAAQIDAFVGYHQDYLVNKDIDLSDPECLNQVEKMIKYFVHLLNYQDDIELQNPDVEAKRFNAVPIHDVNRRSINVDAEVFYFILKDAGIHPADSRASFLSDKQLQYEWYCRIFGVDKDQTGRKRFMKIDKIVGSIKTDNCRLSIAYEVDNSLPRGAVQARPRGQSRWSSNEAVYVSIDPGRVNISYHTSYKNDKFLEKHGNVTLSRKEYYHKAGINKAEKRFHQWNKPLEEINRQLSERHIKTANLQVMTQGHQTIRDYHDLRFEHMFHKCYAKENFHLYSGKQSVIALALNSLQDPDGAPITVLYGGGSFPSGKKFEQYVPVKWFKQACFKRFDVIEIDEFRTSSVCPDCNEQLWKVSQMFKGRRYEVRGLKWCGSNACRSCPIKHRESVGARNILRRHINEGPPIMERNSGIDLDTDKHIIFCPPGQKMPLHLRR